MRASKIRGGVARYGREGCCRRPTSCYEERCCEPLLDVDCLAIEIPAKEVSFEVPCEKGKSSAKVRRSHGPVNEGGHLSPCLPNYHLG